MPCDPIGAVLPDGTVVTGIVCTRGRAEWCSACQRMRYKVLCDWKLRGKKAGRTCDRKLCYACATRVGEDKHLCPPHGRLWDKHSANSKNRKGGDDG